jgi:hypothetical protein
MFQIKLELPMHIPKNVLLGSILSTFKAYLEYLLKH